MMPPPAGFPPGAMGPMVPPGPGVMGALPTGGPPMFGAPPGPPFGPPGPMMPGGIGAPMAPGVGGAPPAPPPRVDPQMIAQLLARLAPPQPMYPAWFTTPPKPDAKGVAEVGRRRHEDLRLWRQEVWSDVLLLRLQDSGIFEDDKALYDAHIIDDYVSTALWAEFTRGVEILAGCNPMVRKSPTDDKLSALCRQYEVAMTWLRRVEELRWANGNADLRVDEAKYKLIHGMVVKRRTIDLTDPDYPFDIRLIDPCAVVPEWDGKRGMRRFWRVYRSTIGNLVADYGDLTKGQRAKLGDVIGSSSSWDDDTEIPCVVEYWDRWWRTVVLPGGTVIVPVMAHEYGEVPVTISYGPYGEPMSMAAPGDTALKDRSGDIHGVDSQRLQDRVFQSTGFVRQSKEAHKATEAVIRRMLYYLKRANDPAIIRYRSNMASLKASPEMDSTPGATNEAILGEEKIDPFQPSSPFEVQAVLQQVMQDKQTSFFPPGAHGIYNGSNISGITSGNQVDAGFDHMALWVSGQGTYIARDLALAGRFWRNHGYQVKYAGNQIRPFMVPVPKQRQRQGEAPAFELTRELIDTVGPDVEIKMVRTRKQDMVPLAQAAKLLKDLGVPFWAYLAEEWFDLPDPEHLQEEGQEERAIEQAMMLPEFAKAVTIPAAFAAQMAEAEGDPKQQALLQAMMEMWQMIALGGMGQEPPGGGPPGAPGQAPPEGMNPPSAAGTSYPTVGQGPGSQTGQMGGPRGPYGGEDVGP